MIAYGREPTERESKRMAKALAETEESLRTSESDATKRTARAWALIGQVILSANEFVHLN